MYYELVLAMHSRSMHNTQVELYTYPPVCIPRQYARRTTHAIAINLSSFFPAFVRPSHSSAPAATGNEDLRCCHGIQRRNNLD